MTASMHSAYPGERPASDATKHSHEVPYIHQDVLPEVAYEPSPFANASQTGTYAIPMFGLAESVIVGVIWAAGSWQAGLAALVVGLLSLVVYAAGPRRGRTASDAG